MSDKPREVLRDHARKMIWELMDRQAVAGYIGELDLLEFLRAYERMRFDEERAGAGREATGA